MVTKPTPSDLERASGADLVLRNGLSLETSGPGVSTAGLPESAAVSLSDGIEPMPIAEDATRASPIPC